MCHAQHPFILSQCCSRFMKQPSSTVCSKQQLYSTVSAPPTRIRMRSPLLLLLPLHTTTHAQHNKQAAAEAVACEAGAPRCIMCHEAAGKHMCYMGLAQRSAVLSAAIGASPEHSLLGTQFIVTGQQGAQVPLLCKCHSLTILPCCSVFARDDARVKLATKSGVLLVVPAVTAFTHTLSCDALDC